MKKKIKRILRFIFTFPQMMILLINGIKIKNFQEYENYTNFFRYFPFASISNNGIATFNFNGKKIKMFCGESNPYVLGGTFGMRDYDKFPNFVGRDVVDIGAAIGDTAVYFGMKGAKKVYSYEINERYFNVCKKNIELNNLENIVKLELCGIGDNNNQLNGSLEILGAILPKRDREAIPSGGIKMKTLDEIVKEHKIKDGILKIDVDGFEYKIIDKVDCGALRKFTHIIIEYHFGIQNLLKRIKNCGFKTNIKEVAKVFVDYHPKEFQEMNIGYIYATRKL